MDKKLWEKATNIVTKSYGKKTSAYRSMAISKKYKELGGKYDGRKDDSKGVTRWLNEEWIMVIPYVTNKQKIPCGSKDRRKHACRPSKRITKKTPLTIQELLRKHDKQDIIAMAKLKKKDAEKYRVNWNKLELY